MLWSSWSDLTNTQSLKTTLFDRTSCSVDWHSTLHSNSVFFLYYYQGTELLLSFADKSEAWTVNALHLFSLSFCVYRTCACARCFNTRCYTQWAIALRQSVIDGRTDRSDDDNIGYMRSALARHRAIKRRTHTRIAIYTQSDSEKSVTCSMSTVGKVNVCDDISSTQQQRRQSQRHTEMPNESRRKRRRKQRNNNIMQHRAQQLIRELSDESRRLKSA